MKSRARKIFSHPSFACNPDQLGLAGIPILIVLTDVRIEGQGIIDRSSTAYLFHRIGKATGSIAKKTKNVHEYP
jgi:hypothetical protein